MSSTSTVNLQLFKATPGSLEPFRTSDVNSNMDKIDAAIGLPYTDFTQASASNTASEVSAFLPLLAIGAAQQGSAWNIKAAGVFAHSATSTTLTWRFKLGGTTFATVAITTPASALSNRPWNLDLNLMCLTTGTSGTWKVWGNFYAKINTTDTLVIVDGGGTKDTTVAQNPEVTIQWTAANAANIATLDAGYVKRITNG
jgi:hypothetical protein